MTCTFYSLKLILFAYLSLLLLQVLEMLDESVPTMSKKDKQRSHNKHIHKKEMNPWLRDKLEKAEVLNIIEPFWSSLYKQVSKYTI